MSSLPITDAYAQPDRANHLLDLLATLPDPRDPRGVRYPLAGLLAVAVTAAGTVTAATARAVRAFYDTHWGHPPAVSTPQGRRAVTIARSRAARNGFLPALAWDDDTIDDPSTVPDPAAVRPRLSSPRVHLEDVEMLARLGATWPEVQARIGLRRNSIETACARAGRRDLAARITSNRRVAA